MDSIKAVRSDFISNVMTAFKRSFCLVCGKKIDIAVVCPGQISYGKMHY